MELPPYKFNFYIRIDSRTKKNVTVMKKAMKNSRVLIDVDFTNVFVWEGAE